MKLISFRTFQKHCDKIMYDCYLEEDIEKRFKICLDTGKYCFSRTCPIWKRLKEVKDERY